MVIILAGASFLPALTVIPSQDVPNVSDNQFMTTTRFTNKLPGLDIIVHGSTPSVSFLIGSIQLIDMPGTMALGPSCFHRLGSSCLHQSGEIKEAA